MIGAADLTTAAVGVEPGIGWTGADDRDSVIGKRAAVDLKAGTLLAPSQFTDATSPAHGWLIVPIAVKRNQLPARGLRPGDNLITTAVPEAGAGEATGFAVVVDAVGQPDVDGTVVVDLSMPTAQGTAFAPLAAEGRIALALAPPSRSATDGVRGPRPAGESARRLRPGEGTGMLIALCSGGHSPA